VPLRPDTQFLDKLTIALEKTNATPQGQRPINPDNGFLCRQ
jgi:hypothetical protein